MKSLWCLVPMIALLAAVNGCKDEAGKRYSVESNGKTSLGKIMKKHARITTIYDEAAIESIPVVVPFSDEQRKYVIELLLATLGVVDGTSDLPTAEAMILGGGKFYWPKDPTKPIRASRYYPEENFRMSGITLSFDRADERSDWQKANLVIIPPNFPKGVFDMGLPASVFQDFNLVKFAQETRQHESISKPMVFYFAHKSIRDLTLKVETREDVIGANAPYPSTFYRVDISRESTPRTVR